MFATHFAGAISRAQFHELHGLSGKLWKAFAAGHVDEAQAQHLAEAIEARKPKRSEPTSFAPPKAPRQHRQKSPDKAKSIERRRRLAKLCPLKPEVAAGFTTCELAVIYIVVTEILLHGRCSLYIAIIAARAGTCETTVRNTIRKARDHGLLYRQERRRKGQHSLANLVSILNREWGEWLRKVWHPRQQVGCKILRTTEDKISEGGNSGRGDGSGEGVSTRLRVVQGVKETK